MLDSRLLASDLLFGDKRSFSFCRAFPRRSPDVAIIGSNDRALFFLSITCLSVVDDGKCLNCDLGCLGASLVEILRSGTAGKGLKLLFDLEGLDTSVLNMKLSFKLSYLYNTVLD